MKRTSSTRRVLGLALAAAAAAVSLSACSFTTADAMCSGGEYPVLAVNSSSGGACVEDGKEPPKGYTRYPEGKVPQHVDDKWDKYWYDHTVDENGKIVSTS